MKLYRIYSITDKKDIKKLMSYDKHKLLDKNNYDRLTVEIDHYEKKCFINLGELYVFVDYDKSKRLLANYK